MTEKRIVLGVTGGVAAYKACELVRLCVKAGIAVDVVMTQAGEHFVSAVTFQALSGRRVCQPRAIRAATPIRQPG